MRTCRISVTLLLGLSLAACGSPETFTAPPPEPPRAIADGVERHDLRFSCGDQRCAAWLYLPKADAPPPVVVMANGFAGTRDAGLEQFAEHFARKGIAAFVFDYRYFGASGGTPRQLVDPWAQLDDWRAALAAVRSELRIDGTRVALWGTSLGGGEALITAATDGNTRAVVAQAPQIDSNVEAEATFPGIFWLTRLLFAAWGDLLNDALGGAPITVPAAAPSGGFGILVDDAAYEVIKTLAGTTYRNEVAARSILTFDDYNPAVQAASLKTPALLIASRQDRFAAFSAAEAFAKSHPNATLAEIDGDHFDIYAAPRNEQAATLAAEFLLQHVQR